MKKIIFILTILALLVPVVNAEEIKHYLAVDETSPSKDILLILDLADDLSLHDNYEYLYPTGITETRITNKTYETKIDTEISSPELDSRVTVFVYNQSALIIVGKNSPAEHVILSIKIEDYLKDKNIPVIVKLSSDITHDDLKEELINETSDEINEIDLSGYPSPFVENGKLNTIIVVGSEAHTDNIIAVTDIAASLTRLTPENVGGTVTFDTDVKDIKAQNAIIVGHPCGSNRMTAEVLGLSYPACGDASTIPENKAVIRLIQHDNGKISLVVMGWTDQLTKVAARVLANYGGYNFKGTELYICGTPDDLIVSTSADVECKSNMKSGEEIIEEEIDENEIEETEIEIEEDNEEPKEIQEKETVEVIYVESEENISCNTGCVYEDKCIPFGMRINSQYCGIDQTLKLQKSEANSCNNNFECKSNLCIDNRCVKTGIFRSIINWFKKIFG